MDTQLAGKVVIVTGATANIGRAIALAFAAEGAQLVVVGRDENAGARVVAQALERGAAGAEFVAADLLDPASPGRIVSAAQALGPIAVLVNNAGGNVGAGLFVDSDPDDWQADIDLNLLSLLRMTHAVLPTMVAAKGGRIINIGSTAGLVGDYMLSLYSTAKAAVHGFTKVLAKELGQHGVTVNCVAPYGTVSEDPEAFSSGSRFRPDSAFFARLAQADPADREKMQRPGGVLERKLARPEEVAAAVIYFAADSAAFVTGQVLAVEGGTLL
ncbi:SDR family oxidoreductase [Mangrovimicrobium sediminis]|uniref:SDR family oxidoreductase n=1 Tax=Mangrovimicrobium sediminis TaxID=2562682 RepID=A0A4Z0M1A1_9GAMM|nr:SDR family NAD(P)-dependent oxidoreductase [Haliea sp. SAOS-164]TGD73299.1 SDR family oxidoreductase [Haliea sp. SAOS-164]